MALKKSKASGEWKTAATWEPTGAPGITDDVEITGGFVVKVATAAKCRSLSITATGTIEGTSRMEIGGTTKPENKTAGTILQVEAGATVTNWTGEIEWASSYTAEEQKINVDKTITLKCGRIVWIEKKPAKLVLAENLSLTNFLVTAAEANVNTNGKTFKAAGMTCSGENVKVTCGASEIVLGDWLAPTGETSLSAAAATFKLTGAKSKFVGGSKSYGTLILTAAEQEVTGNNTIGTLNLETKALAASRFMKGSTQTISALVANGVAGELAKLESTEAGKEWKLTKVAGNVNVNFLELKDSHVDAAPKWYAGTGSTNVSGNENWLFEAEPVASVSNPLSMMV